eukprot:SAG31_NODE_23241_length_508_cov_0.882641_2_plen_49_part_01
MGLRSGALNKMVHHLCKESPWCHQNGEKSADQRKAASTIQFLHLSLSL